MELQKQKYTRKSKEGLLGGYCKVQMRRILPFAVINNPGNNKRNKQDQEGTWVEAKS